VEFGVVRIRQPSGLSGRSQLPYQKYVRPSRWLMSVAGSSVVRLRDDGAHVPSPSGRPSTMDQPEGGSNFAPRRGSQALSVGSVLSPGSMVA
jgi:hypothetical protein